MKFDDPIYYTNGDPLISDGQPPRYSGEGRGGRGNGGGGGGSGQPYPGVLEDYAEIVDDEGDYSSPAKVGSLFWKHLHLK